MRPAVAALLFAALPLPARAQDRAAPLIDRCTAATCVAQLTPDQVLIEAEKLITAKRYTEAKPMLAALGKLPAYRVQARFLAGMMAAQSGDHPHAAAMYKAILSEDPGQTRVRLELAREMLAMGQGQSADRQFKIAQQDRELPPDVAKTIRAVRDVIRAQRAWRLDVDFGFAPDSNINNATATDTVNILWGGGTLPLTLDERAKAKSGVGQTGSLSAGVRLPMAKSTSMLVDFDSAGTNYSGTDYDDYQVQLAAGPEFRLRQGMSLSAEGVGAQRWYGGQLITRQLGFKTQFQTVLGGRDRIGAQLDMRHTDATFDDDYSGWQGAIYGTWEHAVSKSLVVSSGLFARRDWLKGEAYSSTEFGALAGFGGELPHGINFGVSGTASRAAYDAPIWLFSTEPRKDWRFTARASLGNRKLRFMGFSPELQASYALTDASLEYYKTSRLRFRFALARYF